VGIPVLFLGMTGGPISWSEEMEVTRASKWDTRRYAERRSRILAIVFLTYRSVALPYRRHAPETRRLQPSFSSGRLHDSLGQCGSSTHYAWSCVLGLIVWNVHDAI
jgi:hypothetical protein